MSCKHYFKPCNCAVMYCTDEYCKFCGIKKEGGIHPELQAVFCKGEKEE